MAHSALIAGGFPVLALLVGLNAAEGLQSEGVRKVIPGVDQDQGDTNGRAGVPAGYLQELIDRTADNAVLVLPLARFESSVPIRIENRRNLTIMGLAGSEIVIADRAGDVFTIANSSDVSLVGLQCLHANPVVGQCSAPVVNLRACKNITIAHCSLNGCGIEGVAAYDVQGLRLEGNLIHNNSDAGLSLNKVSGLSLTGNLLFANAATARVRDCPDAQFLGNWVEDRPTGSDAPALPEVDARTLGQSPWTLALRGDAKAVDRLLAAGAALDEKRGGLSLAHIALLARHDDLAASLIAKGAPIDTLIASSGDTCLHSAVRENLNQSVKALLARRAAVNAVNRQGQTALHVAAQRGGAATIALLVAAGADAAARDGSERTAETIAASRYDTEVATAITRRPAAPDAPVLWRFLDGLGLWAGKDAAGTWSLWPVDRRVPLLRSLTDVAQSSSEFGLVIVERAKGGWNVLDAAARPLFEKDVATANEVRDKLDLIWTQQLDKALEANDTAAVLNVLGRWVSVRRRWGLTSLGDYAPHGDAVRKLARVSGGVLAIAVLIDAQKQSKDPSDVGTICRLAGWKDPIDLDKLSARVQSHEEFLALVAAGKPDPFKSLRLRWYFNDMEYLLPGETILDTATNRAAVAGTLASLFGMKTLAEVIRRSWPIVGDDSDFRCWTQRFEFLAGLPADQRHALSVASGGRLDVLGFEVAMREAWQHLHWKAYLSSRYGVVDAESATFPSVGCIGGFTLVQKDGRERDCRILFGDAQELTLREVHVALDEGLRTGTMRGVPASIHDLESLVLLVARAPGCEDEGKSAVALVEVAREASFAGRSERYWDIGMNPRKDRKAWARRLLNDVDTRNAQDAFALAVRHACRSFLGENPGDELKLGAESAAWMPSAYWMFAGQLGARLTEVQQTADKILADEEKAKEARQREYAAEQEAMAARRRSEKERQEAAAAALRAEWQTRANAWETRHSAEQDIREQINSIVSPEALREAQNKMLRCGPVFLQQNTDGTYSNYRYRGW